MKLDYSKSINEQLEAFEYYKNRYANYELQILQLGQENEKLGLQLHNASIKIQEMIEQDLECPSSCSMLQKKENQQKEFVKYLEDKIKFYKINTQGYTLNIYEEILTKYKEITNYE